MLIDSIERINNKRYDTWVCVSFCHGDNITDDALFDAEKEILSIVNNDDSGLYRNRKGDNRFNHAEYVCECGRDPNKGHWILTT